MFICLIYLCVSVSFLVILSVAVVLLVFTFFSLPSHVSCVLLPLSLELVFVFFESPTLPSSLFFLTCPSIPASFSLSSVLPSFPFVLLALLFVASSGSHVVAVFFSTKRRPACSTLYPFFPLILSCLPRLGLLEACPRCPMFPAASPRS